MSKRTFGSILLLSVGIIGSWFLIRYALPVLFPFLLGAGIALAAEPLVRVLENRLHCKRWFASGIGVSAVFAGLICLLVLALALLFRQAGRMTDMIPGIAANIQTGMSSLENRLLEIASAAPQEIRSVLDGAVTGFFSDGSAMVDQVTNTLPGVLTRVFSHVASGVLTFATAVLAAFMISGKLPHLRLLVRERLGGAWKQRYLPALQGLRHTVVGWITAQLKLTLVVMGVLAASFLLLRIPHGLVWSVVIAVVDALPVLGCGIVLVPWSMICLLQDRQLMGFGLLGTYVLVFLVRSALEPRLLGKELGLDPLVTLIAIYAGYRLLGLVGMLLAPLCAVVITRLSAKKSLYSGETPPE